MNYWSSSLWNRIRARRARSGSISMRLTTRYMVIRKGDSFTATTVATVTCRCTSSVVSICCARGCANRIRMARPAASRSSNASSGRFAATGPARRINIRGDSGFCRDSLMKWCEDHDIGFVLGLARNRRLVRALGAAMHEAHSVHRRTGKPARRFRDFTYRTRKSWSRKRPRGRQGGASVEGGESAVCGD